MALPTRPPAAYQPGGVYAPPNTSGMSNDPMHDAGANRRSVGVNAANGMTAGQVRSMQQFLVNHGFNVAVDGIYGPITQAAAASFRANHKSGDTFNAKHGLGTHPASRAPVPRAGSGAGNSAPSPSGAPDANRTPSSAGTSSAFDSLLGALLAGGGNVGTDFDPGSFAESASAPANALQLSLAREVAANPAQEEQNQFDISSWYGLDPKAKGYQLSVLGRLGLARSRDAQAATDASANVGDLAKALVGSIGGSANDGSSSVAQAGENAAGTMAALGEASKQYADDIAPLLAAEARGAQSREKASNSQTLLDLKNQLAQAAGQTQADYAQGLMAATDKNNELAQQRFANQGNLLSTLAQMQAVDPNATALSDAKTKAEIAKLVAQTNAIKNPTAKAGSTPKFDLLRAADGVGSLLGVGTDHLLPEGVSVTKLAYTIGSQLQGLGLKKGTPEYQRAGQTLISMFKDGNGNPIVPPASWFGGRS